MPSRLFSLLTCLVIAAAGWTADVVEAWPEPATLPAGKATTFRSPAFSGMPGYPDKAPLFHELSIPAGYDPTRAYPLCVRFQPQGGKPWANEMPGYFGPHVISLAVSRSMGAAGDNLFTLSDATMYLAAIHWVMDHWNVDRTRVIFGGFSAGAWDASSVGMTPGFDRLSTHFLILGAGIRGQYRLPEQAGKPALVANGSTDMNVEWGVKAAAMLKSAKLVVTHYIEPGVGHSVGPLMKKQAADWFAEYDPAAHAAEWLAEGEAKLAGKTTKSLALSRLLAVATLGSAQPESAKALALLDQSADLTEPLAQLAQARAALAAHDFHAVRHNAGLLAKSAAKAKSTRLQMLVEPLLRDSWEWQCIAHQVAVKAAWDHGCGQEAMLLVQAGNGVYKKPLAEWNERADPFPDLAKQMQKLAPPTAGKDEVKVQKLCAELRLKLWNDQLTSAAALQKVIKQLAAAVEPLPIAPTRQRGEALLALLKQHGQFMGFATE